MRPSEALHTIDGLPSECGVIRDRYLGEDPERFVLIFQDDPTNWSVRLSIGKTLHHFQWVKLVGQDGSSGPIDTAITHTIPDEQIRKKVVLFFLRKLSVHPAEYANTLRGRTEIQLFGLEDQELYNQAYKIANNQPIFLRHQVKRAHAIVMNLLKIMEEEGETFSAMTGIGDIPELVSEELEKRGISYVIFRPKMTHPSDPIMYKGRLNNESISDEELLEEDTIEDPPVNENFSDKEVEEKKERARLNLLNLINSGNIIQKTEPLLSSSANKKIASIVNSTSHGPKTKTILVKAELMAFIEQVKRKTYTTKFNHIVSLIGLVGIIGAIVGSISGVGLQPWYFNTVISFFGVVTIGKLIEKRYFDAFGWLIILLGFIGGDYFFGRWGMLSGVIATWIIHLFFSFKHVQKTRSMEISVKKIEDILVGEPEDKGIFNSKVMKDLINELSKRT